MTLEMSPSASSGKSCACCGKPINRARPAAASVTRGADREAYWCLDCWDNDPRAIEQYREVGL